MKNLKYTLIQHPNLFMLTAFKNEDIVIYDINARKMGNYKLTPTNNRLSVNHLNKGLYFIEIDNTVIKFIKH